MLRTLLNPNNKKKMVLKELTWTNMIYKNDY